MLRRPPRSTHPATLFPYMTLFRATNEASVLTDSDAANKAVDADLALQELGADQAGIAYVTATVTVWDRDPVLASEKLRQVEKIIQGRDFTCMVEGLNAVEAWLGSLPGQVYANEIGRAHV